MQIIHALINPEALTIICGDFNFDYWKDQNNTLSINLAKIGFKHIVKEPTTLHGNCIDHVHLNNGIDFEYQLYYPYYTDHEAVCVMLKKSASNN